MSTQNRSCAPCRTGVEMIKVHVLPGVEWNRLETKKSLKKLRALAMDARCEAVLMTHDPEEMKSVFEL